MTTIVAMELSLMGLCDLISSMIFERSKAHDDHVLPKLLGEGERVPAEVKAELADLTTEQLQAIYIRLLLDRVQSLEELVAGR